MSSRVRGKVRYLRRFPNPSGKCLLFEAKSVPYVASICAICGGGICGDHARGICCVFFVFLGAVLGSGDILTLQ